MSKDKLTIGRIDRVDFPSLDLFDLSCKIDTGADTSSMHCHHVKLVEKPDGSEVIRFRLLDPGHILYNDREYEFDNFTEKSIKNSSGASEDRYVITTSVHLFGAKFEIELTLADRVEMRFPVLIGRRFLAKNGVLVDVRKINVSHKQKCKLILGLSN